MGRHYSNDLRERMTAAVLSGRLCREVATLFSVSVASAVKWSPRLRQTGSAALLPARSPFGAWSVTPGSASKNAVCHRAGSSRHGSHAPLLEEVSGQAGA